jgi:hypothetical protein
MTDDVLAGLRIVRYALWYRQIRLFYTRSYICEGEFLEG